MIIIKNGQTIGPGDAQISVFGDLNLEVTKLSYGVKQSHKKAFEWYKKAADQGDEDAMYMLGWY